VMQDEARHVAFGRIALRDYYAQLTTAELAEREEFVVEGCYLMRDRFRGQEIWERLGYDRVDCEQTVATSPLMQAYQALLFSRIVPCVKDIGLWGPRVQQAFAALGVLDMAGINLDELMRADEDLAEQVDAEKRELASRRAEVDKIVAIGATAD
jgi:hypothetical protein